MSDLMQEIGEDLRQQQLKAFWKENGSWIIGGVLLAIVATAVMSFWREHKLQADVESTAQMLSIVREADAAKLTAFADKADKDHAVTAQFIAAGMLMQQGKKDEAAALYAKIENASGVDRVYRDLGALYAARIELDNGVDAATVQKKLEKLTDKKNTWRFSAMETQALLHAREGRSEEAIKVLDAIAADTGAPADVRSRAMTLRELYQVSAQK